VTRALPIALVLIAACGDEGGSSSSKPAPPPAKPAAKASNKKVDRTKQLSAIPKVEDRVPVDERATIRHTFRERDFVSDPTGTENRDPFRSYVIMLPGSLSEASGVVQVPTDNCTKKQLVATNYSLRDLRLVGIVTRGSRKYALFQDSADVGRIVHKDDCLGREKARVKDIGAGFVTLEMIPEQVANQPLRQPEERSIPLYPDELKLTDLENNGEGDVQAPTVAPPPVPSEPVVPAPAPVMPSDPPPP
jgi:Tfp pilus assembly protein PilP